MAEPSGNHSAEILYSYYSEGEKLWQMQSQI
jgi:hypothetical protein